MASLYNSHIVFNEKCELNIKDYSNEHTIESDVTNPNKLIERIIELSENGPTILSPNQIVKIDLKLRETVNVNNQIRR